MSIYFMIWIEFHRSNGEGHVFLGYVVKSFKIFEWRDIIYTIIVNYKYFDAIVVPIDQILRCIKCMSGCCMVT